MRRTSRPIAIDPCRPITEISAFVRGAAKPLIPFLSWRSRTRLLSEEVRMKILDANRLFPADGEARSIAARLYETVRDLPILSPHGHTDPRWFACNEPFPNPSALLIQPDHYIFRMLYSQGISMESLGIPQLDGSENADPREVWRIFARNYY